MQHVTFILGGFAVVMGILALLAGMVALIGRVFVERAATAPTAPAGATPSAPAAPGVPPHHLAVIAAAVAAVTDGRGRIVRVTAPPHQASAWARHGLHQQFASHRVRWDWAFPGPPHVDRHPDAPSPTTPESKP